MISTRECMQAIEKCGQALQNNTAPYEQLQDEESAVETPLLSAEGAKTPVSCENNIKIPSIKPQLVFWSKAVPQTMLRGLVSKLSSAQRQVSGPRMPVPIGAMQCTEASSTDAIGAQNIVQEKV